MWGGCSPRFLQQLRGGSLTLLQLRSLAKPAAEMWLEWRPRGASWGWENAAMLQHLHPRRALGAHSAPTAAGSTSACSLGSAEPTVLSMGAPQIVTVFKITSFLKLLKVILKKKENKK